MIEASEALDRTALSRCRRAILIGGGHFERAGLALGRALAEFPDPPEDPSADG